MISFAPAVDMFSARMGRPLADVASAAVDRWTVAPASRCYVQPAVFLPGQIERIERTEFAPLDVVIQGLKGDFEVEEEATVALRLRDVDLFDGVL